jgi:hypothetical protein
MNVACLVSQCHSLTLLSIAQRVSTSCPSTNLPQLPQGSLLLLLFPTSTQSLSFSVPPHLLRIYSPSLIHSRVPHTRTLLVFDHVPCALRTPRHDPPRLVRSPKLGPANFTLNETSTNHFTASTITISATSISSQTNTTQRPRGHNIDSAFGTPFRHPIADHPPAQQKS